MDTLITDNQLIRKIKRFNDPIAFKDLSDRYSKICYSVMKKYSSPKTSSFLSYESLLKEKDFLLYEAVRTFRFRKKTKFTTWLWLVVKFHCLGIIKSYNKNKDYDDYKNLLFIKNENLNENLIFDIEVANQLIQSIENKGVRKIFKLRYFSKNKKTWVEIGEKMKMSHQTVINLHNKELIAMKKRLKIKNVLGIV